MQTIFISVKCKLGKAYQAADALVEVPDVSEVHSTSGQYDLLVKCYLPDGQDIGHFVTERVQTQPHIAETFTTIAFKAFG
jgi:DNA-binding Lrp family transcriptional regulator